VILRYFDDLDVDATAAAMGCSTGRVKKLTALGVTSLRPLLQFELGTGGDDD
jgi:DNA-directed RNA polymerase specialized sigma24 family protein